MNTRGSLALAQITLLIFGIIAVGWALGSEVKTMSGATAVTNPASIIINGYKPTPKTLLNGLKYTWDATNNEYEPAPGSSGGPQRVRILPGGKIEYVDKTGYWRDANTGTWTDATNIALIVSPAEATSILPTATTLRQMVGEEGKFSWTSTIGGTKTDVEGILKFQEAVKEDLAKKTPAQEGYYYVEKADGTRENIPKDAKLTDATYEGIPFALGKGFMGNLVEGVGYAMVVAGAIKMFGPMLGFDESTTNALTGAAMAGIVAYKGTIGIIEQWKGTQWGNTKFSEGGGWLKSYTNTQVYSVAIGIAVAAAIFYMMYKDESTETVTFTCEPWQAPTGGSMCEQCNKQSILPCSEYQCRSLGQSCELINKGTTEEQCVWINRKDVTAPIMTLWKDALTKDHVYNPDNTVSPPDIGTKIKYSGSSDGCIKAFTPLSFGILTNEPASCKLDYQRKDKFAEMSNYFGGTAAFSYNHTQIMSLPGASSVSAENLTIKNNGEFSLFIRCTDSNGNTNVGNFVFRFCVEKGEDTTPPVIVGTNLLNNMPIGYNKSKVDFEVYTNEPANCKWSHLDQSYEKMEQNMTCSQSILEMNAQMVYRCKTVLNGIKDGVENNFYIRCEDKPLSPIADRNRMMQSHKFNIIGTKPLVIDYVEPNGTVRDSTESVKVTLQVKTSAGYKEGESICYYSPDETGKNYIQFFSTGSYTHSQDLWLPQGDYKYYIRCVDLGGNADNESTTFKVETDVASPVIVRAYNEESNLKIVTDESAECVYGNSDCNYEIKDGIIMSSVDNNKTQHYTSWDTSKTFYIKCQDKYTNQPYPNQCSMILRPEQPQLVEED